MRGRLTSFYCLDFDEDYRSVTEPQTGMRINAAPVLNQYVEPFARQWYLCIFLLNCHHPWLTRR